MAFVEDIESIGFYFTSVGRGGVSHYALRGNRFLTYYCHVADDESGAVFSWEFALGEYCLTRGVRVGANEVLNSFMYAAEDAAVPPALAAVVAQIDLTETLLNSLRFADPSI
ncbi:MAG: hypothetical protein ABI912_01765 [Actinomycetota bacterium]